MNYRTILKHIHARGHEGVLCMENGRSLPGTEGEARVVVAYREVGEFI